MVIRGDNLLAPIIGANHIVSDIDHLANNVSTANGATRLATMSLRTPFAAMNKIKGQLYI